MAGLVLAGVFLFLVLLTIFLGVRIVPQGTKYVVQRLGKFHKILNPGLNIVVPYIDSVAYRVLTKDIVLDIPSQEVITMDNAVIITNAIAFINIVSPEKAVYGIDNYEFAIRNLVQTSLRSIIGEMSLDASLSSRDVIKAKLKEAISDDVADWGIVVKNVEIQDINPSPTMQSAMEQQAAAERKRRATVTEAEGNKAAAILNAEGKKEAAIREAEGNLEASKRHAEAKIILADASKESISRVSAAISDKELPVLFLLGERYVDAIKGFGESENAKMVLLPADVMGAVRGLFSGAGSTGN